MSPSLPGPRAPDHFACGRGRAVYTETGSWTARASRRPGGSTLPAVERWVGPASARRGAKDPKIPDRCIKGRGPDAEALRRRRGEPSPFRPRRMERDREKPVIPATPIPHHRTCGSASGGSSRLRFHGAALHVKPRCSFRFGLRTGSEMLERSAPSLLHTMNRAVAVAEWQGATAALALLDGMVPPTWLEGSYLWDAVLGDLHRRAGHVDAFQRHRARGLSAAPTNAVRELLRRRLSDALGGATDNRRPRVSAAARPAH
jgi:hypothetical protein